jgi:glycosyltransferase involved in cell wall biosynthesis
MKRPDCLLIDSSDFQAFPPGGPLAHSRQLLAAFGPRLALVGICTDGTPTGRWVERELDGRRYHFFGLGRRRPGAVRPLVPARLQQLLRLTRHRRGILSLGVRAAFVQAPEDLIAVSRWGLDRLCYQLHGVENPLAVLPRYAWGGPLARWFDRLTFSALEQAEVILASADDAAIDRLVARSRGRLARERVVRFPTHYDPDVFGPGDPRERAEARRALGWAEGEPVAVCVGRLNQVKGWDLLLAAFEELRRAVPAARLCFVGDGEDRPTLEARLAERGLADRVAVTGFQPPREVARHLRAADLAVVGSHREGWSVAMLEALACGLPMVATDVSGARELVRPGENGFVVEAREPGAFAQAMAAALRLPRAREVSLALAADYRLDRLAARLGARWGVLA